MPEPGDHQHVRLADAAVELGTVANLKARVPGLPGGKTLLQSIGDVGKTDHNLVVGGKHDRTPFNPIRYHRAIWQQVSRREASDE